MAEFILYKRTESGYMPFVVHQKSSIPGLLAQGFRQTLPETSKPQEPAKVEPVEVQPAPVLSNASDSGIKINQISERELSEAIKGVGLVKARRILKAKPIKNIEHLYEVEPGIDWSSIPVNYDLATSNDG